MLGLWLGVALVVACDQPAANNHAPAAQAAHQGQKRAAKAARDDGSPQRSNKATPPAQPGAPPIAQAPPKGPELKPGDKLIPAAEPVEIPETDTRPTAEDYATKDHSYEVLLHWRNRKKWGTSPSMGDPIYGRLPGGVKLEDSGPHHNILTMCKERKTNFAEPRLIELVKYAAKAVHTAMPGPKLQVCNMSVEGGGPMPWSKSHAAGRDVDFAFFVHKDGQPYELNTMLTFERGTKRVLDESVFTFDVERNWLLVKALLTHPTIKVQWIFAAHALRRAMLDHAVAIGEPLEVLIKARQLVKQPGDSAPHDDHFHVRIYCDPGERIHGCRDAEPYWPWIEMRDPRLELRAASLAQGLRVRKKEMRLLAYERIEARRLYDAAPAIAEVALMDPNGEVQAKAIEMVVDWGQRAGLLAYTLEKFLRRADGGIKVDDPDFTGKPVALTAEAMRGAHQPWEIGTHKKRRAAHIRRAYVIIGRMGSVEFAPLLADALRSKRIIEGGKGTPEALLAAIAARHVMSPVLIPSLIDALGHDNSDVREAAQTALRRITNHTMNLRVGRSVPRKSIDQGVESWRTWWNARKDTHDRDVLLKEGFAKHGLQIDSWRPEARIVELVSVMKHPDPVAYNADRVLSWLTARRSILDATSSAKRQRWRDWIGVKDDD